MAALPTVRWGIVATGMISSWFVEDILLERQDAKVEHVIQAIGSSKLEKGQEFKNTFCPEQNPRIYGSYEEVYSDADVNIVYIGTPHGYHYRDCMQAIAAGKNVLCEKSLTINAKQAKEIFDAARAKNVYVAEAMWLRHRPLFRELGRLLHQEKVIGDVTRIFSDFASGVDIESLPPTSRYRDLTLGAGSLLDIGVYALTYTLLALEGDAPGRSELPRILAAQSHEAGIETTTSAIFYYPSTGRQGITTCTTKTFGPPGEVFAVIHGTNGFIEIEGTAPSIPLAFTVYAKQSGIPERVYFPKESFQGKRYEFPNFGRGFVWEAENTALDVLNGRKESAIVPWAESIHIMEIMDEIRRQGNTVYPGE
ncbi:putative oxidoreductase C513,06c [Talaromyces islandicus]|uniref:D-xylose 1-dehydrogenase (NADP(+), D-xylono-1,5-lactone-forming) n=1 Tax=Talaromyces islandicus TaxID=28573 RepID=A0A0U1LT64_TALIS|nr:putative oxidoreductase C513,06c [Talaromyces islandicus]